MEQLYSLDSELTFRWLALDHLLALSCIILFNVLIFLVRARIPLQAGKRIRAALAVLLLLQEAVLQGWEIGNKTWSVQSSLPLHLCGISLVLTSLLLLTRSEKIYQVVYYWGVAGATQALLTPDIYYGFPHFVFLQFFTAHGLIVTGCFWMTFVEGFRPSLNSLFKAYLATNLYAAGVGIFNKLTGSNYMYLCAKPLNPSLLDYLGAWPWYILSLEGIALLLFFLCALPFLQAASPKLSSDKMGRRSV